MSKHDAARKELKAARDAQAKVPASAPDKVHDAANRRTLDAEAALPWHLR